MAIFNFGRKKEEPIKRVPVNAQEHKGSEYTDRTELDEARRAGMRRYRFDGANGRSTEIAKRGLISRIPTRPLNLPSVNDQEAEAYRRAFPEEEKDRSSFSRKSPKGKKIVGYTASGVPVVRKD